MPRIYLHPLPVRIWHWVNALGFVVLIVTGVQVRYGDLVGMMTFESAIKLHNWTGLALIANYFLWLVFYLTSDKISNYLPELDAKAFFRAAFRQLRYYAWGIFHGAPNPYHISPYAKFNPLQKVLYQVTMMLMVPIGFLSGLILWDLDRFSTWVDAAGGVRVISTIHVLCFIFFAFFILVHAYLGALGRTPGAHYREMITGYEEEPEEG